MTRERKHFDPDDSFVSVFDLIRLGIGPSSSHTVGPMRAAREFAWTLGRDGLLPSVSTVRAAFFGSLARTGRGHAIEGATLAGFEGGEPRSVFSGSIQKTLERVRETKTLRLMGVCDVSFDPTTGLAFHMHESLRAHPNGMRFSALGLAGETVRTLECYSVGGGRILDEQGVEFGAPSVINGRAPHVFRSASELLELCNQYELSIAEITMANERAFRSELEIRRGILELWNEMKACARRGVRATGILPGVLRVPRRASGLYRALYDHGPSSSPARSLGKQHDAVFVDWVNVWAIAIAEENAAGGRIITAPTNGAAALLPAVLHYYERFCDGDLEGILRFFLTATAIGALFRRNASISGAEVGCQGEIGVAASMAAAGLAAALGANPRRIEKAAEIAMEHYLGLTCDPVAGLVQIPCIERNAMGALQAINAQRLAMAGSSEHVVSLDAVIETMRQTGMDMKMEYKETAVGGLAANVNQC